MSLLFHWIPAKNGHAAAEALNADLRARRVVSLEKHFCPTGSDPGWAVCVEIVDGVRETVEQHASAGKRVDYRELLDQPTFALFAVLRKLRQEIANKEGVPVYAVMTNEHLATMARNRPSSVEEIQAIEGVGPVRAQKHGLQFLEAIRAAGSPPAKTEGPRET